LLLLTLQTLQNGNKTELRLLVAMDTAINQINSIGLRVSMLMMMNNVFMLLTVITIVLLHGNIVPRLVKLWQVEMDKGIK
jgi:hypothetical protein